MADNYPYLARGCSTILQSEYDDLIYRKVGSATWPEWKHKPGVPTYELLVSATKGVRLVVKEPRFVWEITERVLEVLFDDSETWEQFFELDSSLRKLVEEACGTKVRINIFRARNDYLFRAAKAVQTGGKSKKPTKPVLSSPRKSIASPSKHSFTVPSNVADNSPTKTPVATPTEHSSTLGSPLDSPLLSSPNSKLNLADKEENELDSD